MKYEDIIVMAIVILGISALTVLLCGTQVKYSADPCPKCGSVEVLDLGQENNGMSELKCADCGCHYYSDPS